MRWKHFRSPAGGALTAVLSTLFISFLSVPPLPAQTVRPVVVEYRGKARAKFEVVNDTIFPLNVVLEPKSFTVSVDGEPSFRPLDDSIQLRLSAMSFRLPPQQTYVIFYEARAERLPAWFVIYCTFAGFPRQSGLNVQVELPHTVYLVQKQSLKKPDVHVAVAEFHAPTRRVLIELENTSPLLGRVLRAEARSRDHARSSGGFPFLPQSRRRLEIPWDAEDPPQKLMLRFQGFMIEQQLAIRTE